MIILRVNINFFGNSHHFDVHLDYEINTQLLFLSEIIPNKTQELIRTYIRAEYLFYDLNAHRNDVNSQRN